MAEDPARKPSAAKDVRMRAIVASFSLSLILLGVKFATYHLTRSTAVLSDALESIINVAAAAFAMLSIWVAAKPPDPGHPYGHGKIEYFSVGFEGALIVLAAVGIFYAGARQLWLPHPLPNLQQGALLLTGAGAANALMALFLIRIGKRTDSLTLTADGKHLLTDVYSSIGVIVGLLIVRWTGWLWADGAVACLLGIHILITGAKLVIESSTRLMDASDPRLLDRIIELLKQHRRQEWIDIHQLRAWRAGRLIHVDLHLVLHNDISLREAHHTAKELERILLEAFENNISVLVHMDPCEAYHCPQCRRAGCPQRGASTAELPEWERDRLTRTAPSKPHPVE